MLACALVCWVVPCLARVCVGPLDGPARCSREFLLLGSPAHCSRVLRSAGRSYALLPCLLVRWAVLRVARTPFGPLGGPARCSRVVLRVACMCFGLLDSPVHSACFGLLGGPVRCSHVRRSTGQSGALLSCVSLFDNNLDSRGSE